MASPARELVFVGKRKLEWRSQTAPELDGPEVALVRPLAVARCDADCLFLHHDYSRMLRLGRRLGVVDAGVSAFGDLPWSGPFAYGHECVAEVLAAGSAVTRVKPGQRVVVPFLIACGACRRCLRGLGSHCERRTTPIAAYGMGAATGGYGGALCDVLRVPYADSMLVPLPVGISPLAAASAGDNQADAWRSVAPHLARSPESSVLVCGGRAASIGLYAAAIALALGASRVDYADFHLGRLAIAERCGANALPWRRAGWSRRTAGFGRRYDIVVDATSSGAGLRAALGAVAPGGVCTAVGYHLFSGTRLPLWQMYLNATRLQASIQSPTLVLRDLLACMGAGVYRPELVTTRVAAWEDAPEALLAEDAVKVVVARSELLDVPAA